MTESFRRSNQFCVLRLSLPQNRDVGVRVFPELQEFLVSGFGPDLISREHVRPSQLQVRQGTNGVGRHF